MPTIIETIPTPVAEQAALAFSAVLAVDKGVQSKVQPVCDGWLVIADDGLAILFQQT